MIRSLEKHKIRMSAKVSLLIHFLKEQRVGHYHCHRAVMRRNDLRDLVALWMRRMRRDNWGAKLLDRRQV